MSYKSFTEYVSSRIFLYFNIALRYSPFTKINRYILCSTYIFQVKIKMYCTINTIKQSANQKDK